MRNSYFFYDYSLFKFATLDTTKSALFHGGRAFMGVENPTVTVDQYSMAQIWVQRGSFAELNSIQIGWAVSIYFTLSCN